MDKIQEVAQLLVSSWSMTVGEESERAIPTSHGVLDRALKLISTTAVFPGWARDSLHFVDSRIGLQCVELPTILDWAQKAELTATPNPSYRLTQVQISPVVARKLLRRLAIDEQVALELGR